MDENNNQEQHPEMTAEEKIAMLEALEKYGSPATDIKHNVHTFLKEVLDTKDTTKVGYLSADELGMPSHPVRTFKHLALYADKVLDNQFLRDIYIQEAENTFATSLSRDAKLINLAVIQKKILSEEQKIKKVNKGWFRKKDDGDEKSDL